jgi:hypothetical protein
VQCETLLNTWRSEMGKVGRRVLGEFWKANPNMIMSVEARAQYVAETLEDFRFVYKEPDACVSANAA